MAPTWWSPAGSPTPASSWAPAVAHHGWTPTSYDELAGAVVAGHVLECGTQATGGNFSGLPVAAPRRDGRWASRSPSSPPTARSVITKHDGTGGAVTIDTVTAQLLYEIQSTRYLNPDVTTHLDTIRLREAGPDRVEISGVRGEAPPERLKVCVNELGGFRNTVEFVLTGLDIEAKADWVREQLAPSLTAADVTWTLTAPPAARTPTPRRARPACCGARSRTPRPTRSAARSPGPRSSWRWRRTPASR